MPWLIIRLQQRGLKGRLLLFLFDLASERPSNELTLQASKVHSESQGRTAANVCCMALYGALRVLWVVVWILS